MDDKPDVVVIVDGGSVREVRHPDDLQVLVVDLDMAACGHCPSSWCTEPGFDPDKPCYCCGFEIKEYE
jgi:hypothetical protein